MNSSSETPSERIKLFFSSTNIRPGELICDFLLQRLQFTSFTNQRAAGSEAHLLNHTQMAADSPRPLDENEDKPSWRGERPSCAGDIVWSLRGRDQAKL